MSEMLIRPEALAQVPGLPPLITKYSLQAAQDGGLAVGRWLSLLSLDELDTALVLIGEARYSEHDFLPWTLFAVMLANGEGMPVPVEMNLGLLVRKLVWLLQVEMLRREGHVELDLERVSLETFELSQVRTRRAPGQAEVPAPRLKVVEVPWEQKKA